MAASISGLLIMGIFFTGVLMMFRTTIFGEVVVSDAMKEAGQVSEERARTDISITDTVFYSDTCLVALNLLNQGSTRISTFKKMDFIVHFSASDNDTQVLTFVPDADLLDEDQWAIESIL